MDQEADGEDQGEVRKGVFEVPACSSPEFRAKELHVGFAYRPNR